MIEHLEIQNYKSLQSVVIERVPPLALFVGPNGAGKSNLFDALEFLGIACTQGLRAAVRLKGGYESICHRRARRALSELSFSFRISIPDSYIFLDGPQPLEKGIVSYHYSFGMRSSSTSRTSDYTITHETIQVTLQTHDGSRASVDVDLRGLLDSEYESENKATEDLTIGKSKLAHLYTREFLATMIRHVPADTDELVIPSRFTSIPPFSQFVQDFEQAKVFQLSPLMMRAGGVPERNPELGKHGQNLPSTIAYLRTADPEAFGELVGHLRVVVPSFQDIDVNYVDYTKQLGVYFQESGISRKWTALDVSDGSLQAVGLFLILLDSRIKVAAIEEPENSIHPWILRHFMSACLKYSAQKQILLSSHSLIAADAVPAEALFIVFREPGKGTQIRRAVEIDADLQSVLQSQLLGLGQFWDSGALGGVPTQFDMPEAYE